MLTLQQIVKGLGEKQFSSAELTQEYLQQVQKDALNSFISVTADRATAQAQAADRARSGGSTDLLCGVPLAHKDIFCAKDVRTTCGSRMLETFVAPYDATVIHKLQNQHAVMLGKTNMDEFAMGSSNENSFFGPVRNPWDHERVPGGSSGGSAAAVAAGYCPAATGTDTGGSIRQPAAFCGITGIKPTYGRVSRYGMVAFASSLDQGGVLACDATDAALLLQGMVGFDANDSTSAHRSVEQDQWLEEIRHSHSLKPDTTLRIGLPNEYFDTSMDADTQAAVQEAVKQLEAAGYQVQPVSLPHTDMAIPAYYVIAGAEASTNLSRYDGVRFGHRCENPQSLEDLYARSRAEGFGEEVKRRILTGTYALSVGYYDAYYLQAQKIRRLISQDFSAAFTEVDVLLAPTTPGPAFKLNELSADPVAMYAQDKFTIPASLAGLPAMSVQCGFSQNLPVGMQLIAPAFCEDRLLRLAQHYQSVTDWHQRRPDRFSHSSLEVSA